MKLMLEIENIQCHEWGSKHVSAFSRKIESMEELHRWEQDDEVIDCIIFSTTMEIVLYDLCFTLMTTCKLSIFWQIFELI